MHETWSGGRNFGKQCGGWHVARDLAILCQRASGPKFSLKTHPTQVMQKLCQSLVIQVQSFPLVQNVFMTLGSP